MNNLLYDELTDEEVMAKIETVLRGKADGKGYTVEELDAYFLGFNFQVQLSRGYVWRRIPRMVFESQVSFSADD